MDQDATEGPLGRKLGHRSGETIEMIRTTKPYLAICRLGRAVLVVALIGFCGQTAVASIVGPSDELGNESADEALEIGGGSGGSALVTQVSAPLRLNPPGDFDGSGMVDQGDLDLVLANWGHELSMLPSRWIYDRPDDVVAQATLDLVLVNWGSTSAPGSPVSVVPEAGSASVAMLLLASIFFARTGYTAARRGIERMRSPVA